MADQPKAKPNREAAKDRPPQSAPDREVEAGSERSFSRAELIEDANGLLGIPRELMAGALALDDSGRATFTLTEAEVLARQIAKHEAAETETAA